MLNRPSSSHIGRHIRFFGDIAGGVDTGIDVSLLSLTALGVKVEAFWVNILVKPYEFRIHISYNRRCIDIFFW